MCMKLPAGSLQMCLFSSTNAALMSPFPKPIGLQTPPARLGGTIWSSCCDFTMDYPSKMRSGWEELALSLCLYPFKQEKKSEKQHGHVGHERDRKTKCRNAVSDSARLADSPLTPSQWRTFSHLLPRIIDTYSFGGWSCVNGGPCIHVCWRRKQMVLSAFHVDAANLPLSLREPVNCARE